jgi:hypothetical protein
MKAVEQFMAANDATKSMVANDATTQFGMNELAFGI